MGNMIYYIPYDCCTFNSALEGFIATVLVVGFLVWIHYNR